MKPIPTEYDGVLYRSRLEARWAVFFEALGIPAIYEPFVIENNGLSWKPDFILMNGVFGSIEKKLCVEVKPKKPNDAYIEYLKKVHDFKKGDILIVCGNPTFIQLDGIWFNGFGKTQRVERGFYAAQCEVCNSYTINHFGLDTHQCSVDDIYELMRHSTLSCGNTHYITPRMSEIEASIFSDEYRFDV